MAEGTGRKALWAANFIFLSLFVPPLSLALFFGATLWLYSWQQSSDRLENRHRLVLSVGMLTVLLIAYRALSWFGVEPYGGLLNLWWNGDWGPWLLPGYSGLGVSYCHLRSIYALTAPNMTPAEFSRYYFFFPTYFSGPIMAPQEYLGQEPSLKRENLAYGAARLLYGLLKFGLSSCLQVASPLTQTGTAELAILVYGPLALWGWAFFAGLWLYLNFSAFTDLAIGMGCLLGIRVPENFNRPYRALDISDFWRRWHISLGNWLRANIFNPTTRAANRQGLSEMQATLLPPLLTMVVCGLWHGLTLPFLLWGAYHGAGLAGHQLWRRLAVPRLPRNLIHSPWYDRGCWLVTHAFVTYSWIFFFPVDNARLLFHLKLGLALLGYTR